MTDYEFFLFEEYFKSSEVRKELCIARPDRGWTGYPLKVFTEVRMRVEDEGMEEAVNWDLMAKKIEEDLTFIRIAV